MADTLNGFDLADVIEEAVARSGGNAAVGSDVLSARRSMTLILNRWENKGYNTWRIKRQQYGGLGSSGVQLSRRVDDVLQVNVYTRAGDDTSTESPMTRISADRYAMLTDKDTAGQPSQWYLERDEPPQLFFYPAGRDPNELFVVWAVLRPEDFSRYGSDIDAPARWLTALVSAMAYDMSLKRRGSGKLTPDERLELKNQSIEDTQDALNADRGRTSYRPRMAIGRRGRR